MRGFVITVLCVFCFPQTKVKIYSAHTDDHYGKAFLLTHASPLSIHVISEIYNGPSTHFPSLILVLILLTFKH